MTEKASRDSDEKIMALAEFLGLDTSNEDYLDEITDDGDNRFSYGKQEYLVCTDKEADEEFESYQESLWDDIGIESFSESFRDWIMNNAINEKSFWRDFSSDIENWIEESPDSYVSYFDIDKMKKDILRELDDADADSVYNSDLGIDPADFSEKDEYDFKAMYKAQKEAVKDLDDETIVKLIKDNGDISYYSSDATEKYIEDYDNPYEYLKNMGDSDEGITKTLEPYLDMDAIYDEIKDQDGRGGALAGYDGNENEQGDYFIYRTN